MGESLTEQTKPLTVEFFGLPGVGKTTVSQQIALKLRQQGLQIVFRPEILQKWHEENISQKVMQLFPEKLNHWHIIINSLVLAWQVKPTNWTSFSKAAKIFTNFKRNDAVVRVDNCDVILLDQGLLQEIWSVGLTGNPPHAKYLKREINLLFRDHSTLIIYCQIDVNTAVKRIQNRQTKNSRFDYLDSTQAYSMIEKYALYLEEIISCARVCHIPIIELNGSQTIKSQSEKVINLIRARSPKLL